MDICINNVYKRTAEDQSVGGPRVTMLPQQAT